MDNSLNFQEAIMISFIRSNAITMKKICIYYTCIQNNYLTSLNLKWTKGLHLEWNQTQLTWFKKSDHNQQTQKIMILQIWLTLKTRINFTCSK